MHHQYKSTQESQKKTIYSPPQAHYSSLHPEDQGSQLNFDPHNIFSSEDFFQSLQGQNPAPQSFPGPLSDQRQHDLEHPAYPNQNYEAPQAGRGGQQGFSTVGRVSNFAHPYDEKDDDDSQKTSDEENPSGVPQPKNKGSKAKTSRANKNKNALRNAPGLIFGRVKRGCRDYLEGNEEERDHEDEERLHYIKTIIENEVRLQLNFQRESFLEFLSLFNSATKTWTSLKDVCSKDRVNGRVFCLCVEEFLGEKGEKDFEDWVNDQRGPQIKNLVREKKKMLAKKFRSIFGFLYRKKMISKK